jgi:ABC-2 type transport system ATP-binding protein
MISVKSLTKRFGDIVAVNGVSFEVKKGEVLGFLGPNAAGKTTTMRILTCYLPADYGTAEIAGYDIYRDSLEVRRKVGYLPENTPLYEDMSVLDFLQFVAHIRRIPEKNKRIKKMVELCGLEKVIGQDIGELSRGYRQRVGLAQALIHDPEVLILDEPTSGLDPTQIIEIRELIKEIGREKTIILSTHILPEVSVTCSRVIIINEGRLVASGTPEELARRTKGGEVVYATIRGPKNLVEAKIGEIDKVKEVTSEEVDGEWIRYTVTCDGDLREDLFHLVSKNGWSLRELRGEVVSLEDVFLQLTTKDA